MGIQGIYKELGPGKRVALSKLAADSLAQNGRPFRLAIDIAIWQYQIQAGKGGVNPAIRTLFYRLTRLMQTPIQPIFVFDGPKKPAIKRNKRSRRGEALAISLAKRLIRLFGFPLHDAPGEAEAECALLQRHGIVDAVLSEDVDTIMFGSTKTLRSWSAESKGSKAPTHVSLYDTEDADIKKVGLDREGMVLVALMSGGDYLPEGIPGCGIKVAYQAARGGFGKTICQLKASDKAGIQTWRESLIHELRTNESKIFRTRHKSLAVPEDFPNLEVLGCYTHPVVSPRSTLEDIRRRMDVVAKPQIEALREFGRETFDWDFLGGAIKFIRVMSTPLLVHYMQHDEEAQRYVQKVSTSRRHASTDNMTELRLSFTPHELVPIDLTNEVEEEIEFDREGLALNSDDEVEEMPDVEGARRIRKEYDVEKPDLAWVLEGLARTAIPDQVKAWEDNDKKKVRKSPKKKTGMPHGAMDQFVKTTKAIPKPKATCKASPRRTKTPERSAATILDHPPTPVLDLSGDLTAPFNSSPFSPSPSKQVPESSFADSPAAPRTAPEPICISSSPSPPSPTPIRRRLKAPAPILIATSPAETPRRTPGAGKEAGSVCAVSSRRDASEAMTSRSSARRFKQTSIDGFARKLFPETPTQEATPIPTPPSSSDGVEPDFLDLTGDTPPSRKRDRALWSESPSPVKGRKRILVRTDDGFYTELEVDEDQRDAAIARGERAMAARGIRGRVLRESYVHFMDLTQA